MQPEDEREDAVGRGRAAHDVARRRGRRRSAAAATARQRRPHRERRRGSSASRAVATRNAKTKTAALIATEPIMHRDPQQQAERTAVPRPEHRQHGGADDGQPGGAQQQHAATACLERVGPRVPRARTRPCSWRTAPPARRRARRRASRGSPTTSPTAPPPNWSGLPSWSPTTGNCASAESSTRCCSSGSPAST